MPHRICITGERIYFDVQQVSHYVCHGSQTFSFFQITSSNSQPTNQAIRLQGYNSVATKPQTEQATASEPAEGFHLLQMTWLTVLSFCFVLMRVTLLLVAGHVGSLLMFVLGRFCLIRKYHKRVFLSLIDALGIA